MRSAQTGKQGGVAEIRDDAESNQERAKDNASAQIELDERAQEMKSKEKDQGASNGSEQRTVLEKERADGAGRRAKRNKNDGKSSDKSEGRGEQARSGRLSFAEFLHADAPEHGNVAAHNGQHALRKKRNTPTPTSSSTT